MKKYKIVYVMAYTMLICHFSSFSHKTPSLMKLKYHLLTIFLLMISFIEVTSQNQSIEVSFSALNQFQYIEFDSILVRNMIYEKDTMLYGNDTVLILDYTIGLEEGQNHSNTFKLTAYPNPFSNTTNIEFSLPDKDVVQIGIYDLLGRKECFFSRELSAGNHCLSFTAGNKKTYLLQANFKNESRSAKLLTVNNTKFQRASLVYTFISDDLRHLKSLKQSRAFPFTPGDSLLIVGYTTMGESGILRMPVNSEYYKLQFASNIPCLDEATVEYGGQIYHTIQIRSQCWLKENLNIGKMIAGIQESTNNDTIEKYCWDDDITFCTEYGGYYQWDEMMQYVNEEASQGICPPGWHIPAEEEWKILAGMVDSQYGVGDIIWEYYTSCGFDVGEKLKSTYGWYLNQNGTDEYGFTGLPAGSRGTSGYFADITWGAYFWSSSCNENNTPWRRQLAYENTFMGRTPRARSFGYSVRCIKDQ